MSEYIAFDSHKRYTWVDRQDHSTGETRCHRLEHAPGAVRNYLSGCEPGTAVAVEATGNWYWIIDEIEQAGLQPRLVHPRKAKLMMGLTNKTDKLDAQGLNRLQRNGTLPTMWIPPGPLRERFPRFPSAMYLASYSGTTPCVHASGGQVRYGPLRSDVNRYLKWAFAETANSAAVNHRRCPERHGSQMYRRLRHKGHPKAIRAARHLAEAAFHVLRKKQTYHDPALDRGCTNPG